jgi:myosin heavy subunit
LSKINDSNLGIRDNMDKSLKDEAKIDKKAHRLASFGWFCIRHFAGGVIYNVEGFVEKNKDEINPEYTTIMKKS